MGPFRLIIKKITPNFNRGFKADKAYILDNTG